MSLQAFTLIILAGLIHSGWNIVAKKAGGDARFSLYTAICNAVIWLPLGIWPPLKRRLGLEGRS